MKVLLALTVVCLSLALCDGTCYTSKLENTAKACTDPYNGGQHPFGSAWNTAECTRCECTERDMSCCDRTIGIAEIPGCTGFVDKETCAYKFHEVGDPSKPCTSLQNMLQKPMPS